MSTPAPEPVPIGNSILDDVKKVLGIGYDYDAFDIDIIMHINSAFATLHQLGVGPEGGFSIADRNAVWVDFIGDLTIANSVKTYIYVRVRLIFDPPATSFAIASFENVAKEIEWRLTAVMEGVNPPWPIV